MNSQIWVRKTGQVTNSAVKKGNLDVGDEDLEKPVKIIRCRSAGTPWSSMAPCSGRDRKRKISSAKKKATRKAASNARML